MASLTLDELVVIINAQTKDFKKQIAEVNNQLDGLDKQAGVVDKKTSVMSKSLAAVGKVAKVAFVAAGAAFAAMIGKFVIGGGISRALNIEDAQAKLKGLGHDTKSVEKIMESALGAVRGTAYGLDAAATTAASAVAAGIKPGKELTKYLTLTADAATIAGIGMDEMGSIMNKVTTSGRAMTDNLNQLSDRGIPIFQWLQEEYKVSAEELRKMVSDGKVDAETFRRVIEKNIGGAALASGSTTRGAWENMKAAMARVGAAIVSDIIPKVRGAFGDMTKWFDDNSESIVSGVSRVVDGLADFGRKVIEAGKAAWNFLAPALKTLYNEIANNLVPALQRAFSNIQPFVAIIGGAAVAAVYLFIQGVTFAVAVLANFINMLSQNTTAFQMLVGGIAGVIVALTAFKTLMVAKTAIVGIYTTATIALSAVQALQAQGLGFLKAAWIALNIAMAANPIGLVIAAVGLLVGALYGLGMATSNTEGREARLNRERQESIDLAQRAKTAEDDLKNSRHDAAGAALAVERAQRTYNDAVRQYGKNSLEAREAAHQLKSAQDRLKDANNRVKKSTDELNAAHKAQQDYIQGVINKLNNLNGKNVTYFINGEERVTQRVGNNIIDSGTFHSGGFTGRGGKYEPAGIVHKGEYVIPKELVDQASGLPKMFKNLNIPKFSAGGLVGSGAGMRLDRLKGGGTPVNVNIDGERLLNFVIGGINNKSFMNNRTVIEY
jgi:tape measure domain-containing protein